MSVKKGEGANFGVFFESSVAGERKYDIFELGLDLIGFTNSSIVKDVTLADGNLVYLKSGRP